MRVESTFLLALLLEGQSELLERALIRLLGILASEYVLEGGCKGVLWFHQVYQRVILFQIVLAREFPILILRHFEPRGRVYPIFLLSTERWEDCLVFVLRNSEPSLAPISKNWCMVKVLPLNLDRRLRIVK